MTTLIVDLDNKIIATDRQTTTAFRNSKEQIRDYKDNPKIRILEDYTGMYLLGTGDRDTIDNFADEYCGGNILTLPCKGIDTTIIVVRYDMGKLTAIVYESKDKFWRNKWEITYVAEGIITGGSGAKYAEGALATGATHEEAIRAAIKCDQYSGMGIDILDLNKEDKVIDTIR